MIEKRARSKTLASKGGSKGITPRRHELGEAEASHKHKREAEQTKPFNKMDCHVLQSKARKDRERRGKQSKNNKAKE